MSVVEIEVRVVFWVLSSAHQAVSAPHRHANQHGCNEFNQRAVSINKQVIKGRLCLTSIRQCCSTLAYRADLKGQLHFPLEVDEEMNIWRNHHNLMNIINASLFSDYLHNLIRCWFVVLHLKRSVLVWHPGKWINLNMDILQLSLPHQGKTLCFTQKERKKNRNKATRSQENQWKRRLEMGRKMLMQHRLKLNDCCKVRSRNAYKEDARLLEKQRAKGFLVCGFNANNVSWGNKDDCFLMFLCFCTSLSFSADKHYTLRCYEPFVYFHMHRNASGMQFL